MRPAVTFAAPLLAAFLLPHAVSAADDVPMAAMKDELTRTTSQLRLKEMERPYFVAFRLDEVEGFAVSAELGSLTSARRQRARRQTVELRVGDRTVDNSNWFSGRRYGWSSGIVDRSWSPLDDDYQQIRRRLWRSTDELYKRALEDLTAKRAVLRGQAGTEAIPDFTSEPSTSGSEPWVKGCPPRAELEATVRELSEIFRSSPEIRTSSAKLDCQDVYVRYVNSEGTILTRADPRIELEVQAETLGAGARPASDSFVLHGRIPGDLPPRAQLIVRTRELLARVLARRTAKTLERYAGPVLFEGTAAAELFAQRLAPALVAFRLPVSDEPRFAMAFERFLSQAGGASFADKVGASVLPPFLSVTDDPARRDYRSVPLLGARRLDDEGVATRATKLIERGRLKALLSTRTPSRTAPRSTGSRRGFSAAPSNLIVSAERALPKDRLRKELLRRARERGLDHAIVIRRVGAAAGSLFGQGSGEGTGAATLPEVYRVFADGREEPLQGMELGDFTAASFKDIVAAGDAPQILTLELSQGPASLFSLAGRAAGGDEQPLVSFVVPSLLFDELALVTNREPIPDAPVTPSPLAAR